MWKQQQLLIKVMSMGDSETGKSCLIKRYCEGRFFNKYIPTIGVDYGVKKMVVSGKKVAVNFFDLSGDDDFAQIRNPFIKEAQGVILVCSMTKRNSLQGLARWESLMKKEGLDPRSAVVFVVGNKSDEKGKELEAQAIKAYASKKGYESRIVSASSGQGVPQLFEAIFAKCVAKIEQQRKQIAR